MLNYILEVLIMASLGLILYLFARALPRVDDADLDAKPRQGLPHWAHTYLERADEWTVSIAEKTIRRFRLWILKLDNGLSLRLKRFKRESAPLPGFTEEPKKNGNGNGDGHTPAA